MFAEFARGSEFPRIVATDYAEAMCARTLERIASSPNARARRHRRGPRDVGNLPFDDDAFAAVHSAAGIHCWPEPARGLEEVSRVLKPGGTFVASTVVLPEKARAKMTAKGLGRERRPGARKQNMPFWDRNAVLAMWRSTPGFEDAESIHAEKAFVMISVSKGSRDGRLGNNAVSRPDRVNVPEKTEKNTEKIDDETPEILNQWWPVAFEHQLDADGDKLAVSLFGEPLVLYRTDGGVVNCVQDRCAHKSCPLSPATSATVSCCAGTTAGRTGRAASSWTFPRSKPAGAQRRACRSTRATSRTASCTSGSATRPNAVDPNSRPLLVATRSMKGVETLSWPRLTETREWDGVPWHSAVEITQDFTHLQFVHPNTQAGGRRSWSAA